MGITSKRKALLLVLFTFSLGFKPRKDRYYKEI